MAGNGAADFRVISGDFIADNQAIDAATLDSVRIRAYRS